MDVEEVQFYSDGVRVSGLLRLPEERTGPLPVVIHPPGWLGIADGPHYLPWHERFLAAGYAVLVFDYRGFGRSDGERGWVRLDWQVDDLLAAVTYATTRPELDPDRIGLFGMGATGGGNAIVAASIDESIRCVVAQTVIADGADWLRRMRRAYEWEDYLARIREDRVRWVLEGRGTTVHPREDLMVEPPERKTHNPRRQVDEQLPTEFFLRNADLTMRYRPIDVVHRIAPRALLLVGVTGDVFTFEDHATALYERAGAPKRLLMQHNTTHWESYVTNYDLLTDEMVTWFDTHLAPRNGVTAIAEPG